jgi:uncharacterized membrane protein
MIVISLIVFLCSISIDIVFVNSVNAMVTSAIILISLVFLTLLIEAVNSIKRENSKRIKRLRKANDAVTEQLIIANRRSVRDFWVNECTK